MIWPLRVYFQILFHGEKGLLSLTPGGGVNLCNFKVALEIRTCIQDFLNGIKKFREVVGSRSTGGAVLYNGDQRLQFEGVQVFNPFVQEGMHSL